MIDRLHTTIMSTMNYINNMIFFLPACMLCPQFQASFNLEKSMWTGELLNEIIKNSQGIIQMPCPESVFCNDGCGIGRKNHGVSYYEKLEGFTDYCYELASQTADMVDQFMQRAKAQCVIVGIEHSPTCAVNYIYMGKKGTVHRMGIYMNALDEELKKRNLLVEYIGVNRRFPRTALKRILELSKE